MIAIIRARFPGPHSQEWTDAAMTSWMDPNIPFSLAHFMKKTSLQQLDMSYHLFPSIVLDDPRADAVDPRQVLVEAVLKKLTTEMDPDWDLFERFIICFAQYTDLFGGGAFALPESPHYKRRLITGAVVDVQRRFDGICHEVGHAFGLQHERTELGGDYGCPFSTMSAMRDDNIFDRPEDPRLPKGVIYSPQHPDTQRIVGPFIPAVHFYLQGTGSFVHPHTVIDVPSTYRDSAFTFRLYSLDAGLSRWPQRKPILAVVPAPTGSERFFIEFRRKTDYDQGIPLHDFGKEEGPACCLVIYLQSPDNQIRFVDTVDIADRDFRSFGGHFIIRINNFGQDNESVGLTIGSDNAWRNFGVVLETPISDVRTTDLGHWQSANAAACFFLYGAKEYSFRSVKKNSRFVLRASSNGYEKPYFGWSIAGQPLSEISGTVKALLDAKNVVGANLLPIGLSTIVIRYNVAGNRLELFIATPLSEVHIKVGVTVSESSTDILKNYYDDQSTATNVPVNNVAIEWDDQYLHDMAQCWRKFFKIHNPFKPLPVAIGKPSPRPKWREFEMASIIRQELEKDVTRGLSLLVSVARATEASVDEIVNDLIELNEDK